MINAFSFSGNFTNSHTFFSWWRIDDTHVLEEKSDIT